MQGAIVQFEGPAVAEQLAQGNLAVHQDLGRILIVDKIGERESSVFFQYLRRDGDDGFTGRAHSIEPVDSARVMFVLTCAYVRERVGKMNRAAFDHREGHMGDKRPVTGVDEYLDNLLPRFALGLGVVGGVLIHGVAVRPVESWSVNHRRAVVVKVGNAILIGVARATRGHGVGVKALGVKN